MTNLTEQLVFDYFVEQDRKLTLADLAQHFINSTPEELLLLVNNLVEKRFLDENPAPHCWNLSSRAKRLLQQEQARNQPESGQQKGLLAKTKTGRLPISKSFAEFLINRRTARLALILVLVLALLELIRWLF